MGTPHSHRVEVEMSMVQQFMPHNIQSTPSLTEEEILASRLFTNVPVHQEFLAMYKADRAVGKTTGIRR